LVFEEVGPHHKVYVYGSGSFEKIKIHTPQRKLDEVAEKSPQKQL
jgi:hypothetical protein